MLGYEETRNPGVSHLQNEAGPKGADPEGGCPKGISIDLKARGLIHMYKIIIDLEAYNLRNKNLREQL